MWLINECSFALCIAQRVFAIVILSVVWQKSGVKHADKIGSAVKRSLRIVSDITVKVQIGRAHV